ncbi:putative amidase domain protein [Clostridium acetireducens DSM 10703]|uniref:Putative amidase domain protein n=1 Tax=Clostridium acetireducens DSM 10703 TaxID=1121290 RepID=A0A1E8EVW6_9CLOT|nr:amidase domain-containing protein [Clostridium acetireducens]OFI01380.1 putative amidase domain protein [Clostridium acetireducens DSM 10703]
MRWRQNGYSRVDAVRYATTYALSPNPAFRYFPVINNSSGDCTNFISQCLLAGGAKMQYNNSHPWWYNNKGTPNVMDDTWSIPWAVANSLYYYLKTNQEKKSPYVKGLEVYDKSLLDVGDLICYEGNDGVVFHSAIITSFFNGEPLVSQHSFEALNIPYEKSWITRKHHFLKISI